MSTNSKSPRDEADERWLDELLRATLSDPHAEQAARQGRLARLSASLADAGPSPIPAADHVEPAARATAPRRSRSAWLVASRRGAVALLLLLALVGAWRIGAAPREASAMVLRSLRDAEGASPRQYRVELTWRGPIVGERRIEATLHVQGRQRLTLLYPAVLPWGSHRLGANERECWVVPVQGPVLVGGPRLLEHWTRDHAPQSSPFLHIASILERMSRRYRLQRLPDEELSPVDTRAGSTTRCQRVVGELQLDDSETGGLPARIELWIDPRDGVAQRVELDWALRPEQAGRSRLVVELVARPELPDDWFEHSSHHGADRPVLALP